MRGGVGGANVQDAEGTQPGLCSLAGKQLAKLQRQVARPLETEVHEEGIMTEGILPDRQRFNMFAGVQPGVVEVQAMDKKGIPPDQLYLYVAGKRPEVEELLVHADRQLEEGEDVGIPPELQGLIFAYAVKAREEVEDVAKAGIPPNQRKKDMEFLVREKGVVEAGRLSDQQHLISVSKQPGGEVVGKRHMHVPAQEGALLRASSTRMAPTRLRRRLRARSSRRSLWACSSRGPA